MTYPIRENTSSPHDGWDDMIIVTIIMKNRYRTMLMTTTIKTKTMTTRTIVIILI